MLRQLRSAEKIKRYLWIGLLLLIIPSLVAFYGFGDSNPNSGGQPMTVATIDYPQGEKGDIQGPEMIMAKNYLQDRIARYAQEQGTMLDPQAAAEIATEKAIIDQAVNLDILRNYADRNGLTVTSEEVIASIQEMTTPQQREMLVMQLQQQGRTIDHFVEEQRRGRLLAKATDSIGARARVTHYEVWQEYLENSEQLVVDTYRVNASDFLSSVTVTPEGLGKYYEDNKENFRVADQLQYEYVLLRKDDIKTSLTVSADEITSYYTNNKEDFRLPRKVEANQIFLKIPSQQDVQTTSAAELTSMTEAVTAKANEVYERAAKGEDFAALASQFNEETNFPPRADEGTTASDSVTTAGGNLGLISEDVADTWYGEQWTSSVFSMQPGSITRPIKTPTGYTITQVQKIVEGELQPMDQVKPVIESRIKDLKAQPLFDQVGKHMAEISGNVTGLQQFADATSGTVVTSGKVNQGEKFIPGIGILGEFEEAVIDLQSGGHSDVLSDSQRHLVIQIKQEFPSHIPELDAVKGRVEQNYKQTLAEKAAKDKAEDIFQKSQTFEAFQKTLSDMSTTYTHSKPFKRPEAAAAFGGMVDGFTKETAGLKKGDIRMSEVGRPGQQQSYVIWHVDQVIEPSKTEFARDLGKLSDSLVERKRQIMVLEYIRDQRQKLGERISIDESFR